ncbi:hypothetical protein [Arthrobacter sp. CP30]
MLRSRPQDLWAKGTLAERRVEAKVEQWRVFTEVFEPEKADAAVLVVIDSVGVIVVIAVRPSTDGGLHNFACGMRPDVERELIARHEGYERFAVGSDGINACKGNRHKASPYGVPEQERPKSGWSAPVQATLGSCAGDFENRQLRRLT